MIKKLLCPLLLLSSFKTFAQVKDTVYYDQKISGVWYTTVLNELTYDDNCVIDWRLSKIWDAATQLWINASRSKDKYDASGNFIETLEESWDRTTESWNKSSRYIQTVSTDGLTTTFGFQFWDNFMKTWINTYRATNTRNVTGDSIVTLFDFYTNNSWQNSSKSLLILNKDGITQESLSESWQNNSWIKNYRQVFTYTDNYLQALNNGFVWDASKQGWVLRDINKVSYHQPGMQEKASVSQILINNQWQFVRRSKSTFNSMDMQASSVSELWDTDTNEWIKNLRFGYSYYKDGASKTSVTEFYDTSANEWNSGYRIRNTHHGCLINVTLKTEDADKPFNSLITKIKMLTDKGNESVIDVGLIQKNKFMAANKKVPKLLITLSKNKILNKVSAEQVTQNASNEITLAPNPARHYFTLSLKQDIQKTATLKITDMTGKVVLQQALAGSNVQKINIEGITKGLYIVTVVSGKSTFNQKLIIQ